jgi:hypothetical protein
MKGYDLDEKAGLFGMFGGKTPTKALRREDFVEIRHYSTLSTNKSVISDLTDSTINIMSREGFPEANLAVGDPIVLVVHSSDQYLVSGDIQAIHNLSPLEATVKVTRLDKLKDLVKSEKFPVSLPASVKIIGVTEPIPVTCKQISFGGVKINCREDIMLEDMIELTVKLDKTNKMNFRGRIVRKNKLGNTTEYGVEISEMAETGLKNLHHFINDFQFG